MDKTIGEGLACELERLAKDVRDFEARTHLAKIKVEAFSGLLPYLSPETMAALEEFSVNPHAFDVTVAAHYVGNALKGIKWMQERHVKDVESHNAL